MGVSFEEAKKTVKEYSKALDPGSEANIGHTWWRTIEQYFANPPMPPAPTDEAKAAALEWVRNSAFAWVSEDQLWECQECSEAGRTMDLTPHTSTCIVATLEATLSVPSRPTDGAKTAALDWVREKMVIKRNRARGDLWEWFCVGCQVGSVDSTKAIRHKPDCPTTTIEAALSAPTETREEERVRVLEEISQELGELAQVYEDGSRLEIFAEGRVYWSVLTGPVIAHGRINLVLSALDAELAKCREKQEPPEPELSPWIKLCLANIQQVGLSEAEKAQLRAAVDGAEEKGAS